MRWVGEVGRSLQINRAALRRALVDEKYLDRSPDRQQYRLSAANPSVVFDPEVEFIDAAQVVREQSRKSIESVWHFRIAPRVSIAIC
jgi:hypothetical protein